ncbi:SelL-related redox protein [Vampirovibrio chlorellavorus]|uniref:SelL-related redox protein n=1 Tax=Vampirovibrio chlorellavorus TaxID=758823 RepID=UPI0026EEFF36|nr:SelL-related redox protein [Vampirovibrio chlorellavorus]
MARQLSAQMPQWSFAVLAVAGIYNILWGGFMVLFPNAVFQLSGAVLPNYPELWQCIGMIVGVYGLGYLIAATDPRRHWPIVLVGLLGKIFGPMGFALALVQQRFPLLFGLNIVTNDLIWWVPFFLILKSVYTLWRADRTPNAFASLPAALDEPIPALDASLRTLSQDDPLLLIFLRHSGCTFCMETLTQLARQQDALKTAGLRAAVVMMSAPEAMETLWQRYGLQEIFPITDPDRRFYKAFGLSRANFQQVFGGSVWVRGFQAWTQGGHGIGPLDGDGFQLGGAFLIQAGQVIVSQPQTSAADPIDWERFLSKTTQYKADGKAGAA